MKKAELESEVYRLRKTVAMFRDQLQRIRAVARDCVRDNATINNVYVIEKITETLTKEGL